MSLLKNLRLTPLSLLACAVISCFFVCGHYIYRYHAFPITPKTLLLFLMGFAATALVIVACRRLRTPLGEVLRHSPALQKAARYFRATNDFATQLFKKPGTWAIATAILAGWYLLCYLAYWPGVLSYDTKMQFEQVLGVQELTAYHPPLHTAFIALCFWLGGVLGSHDAPVIIYSLAEMAIVIATCIYALRWCDRHNAPALGIAAAYLAFLLFPNYALMTFSPTKDVFFACFAVLFILNCCEIIFSKAPRIDKRHLILICLFGTLACLFRNNAVYAFALLALIVLLARFNKQLLACLTITIAMALIMQTAVFPMLGFAKGNSREALSVPISQLSAVYVMDGNELSANQADELTKWVPDASKYNPRFADDVKRTFDTASYNDSPSSFWMFYLSVGLQHPLRYAVAFLDLNIAYWWPFAETPDPYSNPRYIETQDNPNAADYSVDHPNWLPSLRGYYESFALHENPAQNAPIIGFLFSTAFPFAFFVAFATFAVNGKRRASLFASLVMLAYLATLLLGPISNFRYVYPLYLFMPIALCLYWAEGNMQHKNNDENRESEPSGPLPRRLGSPSSRPEHKAEQPHRRVGPQRSH